MEEEDLSLDSAWGWRDLQPERGQGGIIGLQFRSLLIQGSEYILPLFVLASACRYKSADSDTFNDLCMMVAHLLESLRTGVHQPLDPWAREWPVDSAERDLLPVRLCDGERFFVIWSLGMLRLLRAAIVASHLYVFNYVEICLMIPAVFHSVMRRVSASGCMQ